MSDRQARLLAFIIAYKQAHDGCAPTIREMADGLGYKTTSAVSFHLARMAAAGLIRVDNYGSSRSIEVVGGKWVYEGQGA